MERSQREGERGGENGRREKEGRKGEGKKGQDFILVLFFHFQLYMYLLSMSLFDLECLLKVMLYTEIKKEM